MRGIAVFVRDIWRLSRPYFMSEERWSGRGLLAFMIVLRLALVGITVALNYWNNAFFNTLQTRDWHSFVQLLLFYKRTPTGIMPGFVLLATVYVVIAIFFNYVTQWLQIRWRRWMTARLLDDWLSRRAYYRMSLARDRRGAGTDNPDQRISEDVRDFVSNACVLSVGLLGHAVTIVSFLGILWTLSGPARLFGITIPGYLVWTALLYSVVGTWLTHLVGRKLIGLNFRKQRVEADFRYALVRVRENVEGIALHAGETEEKAQLGARFSHVVENWWRLMNRNLRLDALTSGYFQIAGIFPLVVAAPRYFAGKIQLGGMMQAVGAFSSVQSAMSWFINAYQSLAEWRAIVERLTTFQEAIGLAGAPLPAGLAAAPRDAPGLAGATLSLPTGADLLRDADLTFRPGESAVVTGRSGSGKSTLFRALAGLWPYGRGALHLPERAMFLPQHAYIPLGTLRNAATYPAAPDSLPEAEIVDALTAVGLGALAASLDDPEDWPRRLSGGEQQRVAFARALLAKPAWLFLDEATASLDPDSEAHLYRLVRERLPGTTIVSIAHRASVVALHDRRIVFDRPGEGPGRLVEERRLAAE